MVFPKELCCLLDWNLTEPKRENTTDSFCKCWDFMRRFTHSLAETWNPLTPLYFHSRLSQVLRQKQVDAPEFKQVSVRRFATFDLFSRKRLLTHDPSDTSDDQWAEYRSVYFPEYSALLRYTHTRFPLAQIKHGDGAPHKWAVSWYDSTSWVKVSIEHVPGLYSVIAALVCC